MLAQPMKLFSVRPEDKFSCEIDHYPKYIIAILDFVVAETLVLHNRILLFMFVDAISENSYKGYKQHSLSFLYLSVGSFFLFLYDLFIVAQILPGALIGISG